jgi:hypothetical protein
MKEEEKLELRLKIQKARDIEPEIIRELSASDQRLYAAIREDFSVQASEDGKTEYNPEVEKRE